MHCSLSEATEPCLAFKLWAKNPLGLRPDPKHKFQQLRSPIAPNNNASSYLTCSWLFHCLVVCWGYLQFQTDNGKIISECSCAYVSFLFKGNDKCTEDSEGEIGKENRPWQPRTILLCIYNLFLHHEQNSFGIKPSQTSTKELPEKGIPFHRFEEWQWFPF